MSKVHIYVEGGGDGPTTRRKARKGFEGLLRGSCSGGRNPKIIMCGGRESAYGDFIDGLQSDPDAFVILLVDAEGPVTAPSAKQHLPWPLGGIGEDQVHLMVQTFEAWVVADVEAIAKFYGQGFRRDALPQNPNLEAVSKDDLNAKLENATRGTKKRTYHKIDHGPSILAKADAVVVRGKCSSCEKLFAVLAGV